MTTSSIAETKNLRTSIMGLFFVQLFATLSFSVLYSTLVLYLTSKAGLSMNKVAATAIMATFAAFNYGLHLLGGYVGGRYLSYRNLFIVGMIIQTIGCFIISSLTDNSLYWGLALFLTGSGLNVTCINCMVMQLFKPTDDRREGAFLWTYSGMNVGFFIGFLVSGHFQLLQQYQPLFIFAGIGNIVAAFVTFLFWKRLADKDTSWSRLVGSRRTKAAFKAFAMIFALIFAMKWLLENANFSNKLVLSVGAFMVALIFILSFTYKMDARKKMWAYLIFYAATLTWGTLYGLVPQGLIIFAKNNVNLHYMGLDIAPQWINNINSIVIAVGGPLLAYWFNHLRQKGVNVNIPTQFAAALLLVGAGVGILPIGIHFADAQGYTNFNWIIVSYILQSLGELFISPIGYAMIGKLAPQRLQGLMMGMWMLATGVAAVFAHFFSEMAMGSISTNSPLMTNPDYSHTFMTLGLFTMGFGVVLYFIKPYLMNLMGNSNTAPQAANAPASA